MQDLDILNFFVFRFRSFDFYSDFEKFFSLGCCNECSQNFLGVFSVDRSFLFLKFSEDDLRTCPDKCFREIVDLFLGVFFYSKILDEISFTHF